MIKKEKKKKTARYRCSCAGSAFFHAMFAHHGLFCRDCDITSVVVVFLPSIFFSPSGLKSRAFPEDDMHGSLRCPLVRVGIGGFETPKAQCIQERQEEGTEGMEVQEKGKEEIK